MSKPYYLVCYGHALRVSSRTDSPTKALKEMFGTKPGGGSTCFEMKGSGWAYISGIKRREFIIKAAQLHYDKTGLVLSGCENEIKRKKVPS